MEHSAKSMKLQWWRIVALVIIAAALGALAAISWVTRTASPRTAGTTPASVPEVPTEQTAAPPQPQEIEVNIPPESLERIHIKLAKVTELTPKSELRVPGTVQPNAYQEVHVMPIASGIVMQVLAELGQTVKRGQPLAELFSRELGEAQAEYAAVTVELEAEHKKLVRTQELVRLGAASREELETVEASHQVHVAHVEEARQKLLLVGLNESQISAISAGKQAASNITISTPIDGVVLTRSVNRGQVIATGQELFTVSDLSSVWIEGNLLENDFAAVRIGSRALITTPAYPGKTYRGTVDYIEPRVDPQTRTAKVRVLTVNPNIALRIGMYMDMTLTGTGGRKLPAVPKQAIQQIGPMTVVYVPVAKEEGRFVQRTVKTGEQVDDYLLILDGLKVGDQVVTEGSFLLRAESLRQHP